MIYACRLTCTDKFPDVPTKLRKSIIGGGGGSCPPAPPPPPPPLATLVRQGNCYNRSPMWPSYKGFKPFATKKQHDFVYMMILDNNSLSFQAVSPVIITGPNRQ